MKRTLMQLHIKNSAEAAAMYCEAFDAPMVVYGTYDDGNYMHAEIDVQGQIVAVSEAEDGTKIGTNIQLCFEFGAGYEDFIRHAFEVLSVGGTVIGAPAECDYSPLQTVVIDRFGVYWCLFI